MAQKKAESGELSQWNCWPCYKSHMPYWEFCKYMWYRAHIGCSLTDLHIWKWRGVLMERGKGGRRAVTVSSCACADSVFACKQTRCTQLSQHKVEKMTLGETSGYNISVACTKKYTANNYSGSWVEYCVCDPWTQSVIMQRPIIAYAAHLFYFIFFALCCLRAACRFRGRTALCEMFFWHYAA